MESTLRELPLQGKVQKRIVRLAARGNAGSGCCQRKHATVLPKWPHFSLPPTSGEQEHAILQSRPLYLPGDLQRVEWKPAFA
jgi:hypothetical protein